MATIRGGDKFEAALAKISRDVAKPAKLKVGFLQGSTYPDGKPTALIAAIHNYGAPAAGIPPRPFFSNMVRKHKGEWPKAIADLLKANEFDAVKALEVAGHAIAGQLRQSIRDTNDPPLKPATIARKGFDKPLIDTSHMINSVDSKVVEGS